MLRPLAIGLTAAAVWAAMSMPAGAQEEFAPPDGKGRVVVVVSGVDGPGHYRQVAGEIAKLGYDAVLYDARQIGSVAAFRAAIVRARGMPNAVPGRVGLVGFSRGGGQALAWGSGMGDLVAVDVVWYPVTAWIRPAAMVSRMRVPTVMLAGEADRFRNCCLIEKAREIGQAARAAGAPLQLTTYPGVGHNFVLGARGYDPQPYADAFRRTVSALRAHLR
jgi:dienelactone hydrolase